MVNSNADALGIIFPNSYDSLVPELVAERLMASIPFAGRYRMVDFILSSMVNCGIGNVSIVVRKNYHSLMDHLGSGREWDLTRKSGCLLYTSYSGKNDQQKHPVPPDIFFRSFYRLHLPVSPYSEEPGRTFMRP